MLVAGAVTLVALVVVLPSSGRRGAETQDASSHRGSARLVLCVELYGNLETRRDLKLRVHGMKTSYTPNAPDCHAWPTHGNTHPMHARHLL
jgi:hypothetical protein